MAATLTFCTADAAGDPLTVTVTEHGVVQGEASVAGGERDPVNASRHGRASKALFRRIVAR